ncbi:MAG: 2-oxoacid:acceptor oxidoreductase family protein [Nanoarchaeota archaeon]
MAEVYAIRFHGRGGQGAKTASAILAEAALHKGKFIQSFPEYGAERMGAPVKAFTRISDEPIRIHYGVKHPNLVVVVDFSLVNKINVTDGLTEEGKLIVNTPESPEKVREITGFNGEIHTIDASKIAVEEYKKNVPNTPLLGAIVKVTNVVELDDVKHELELKMKGKLGDEIFKKNLNALERAYNEIQ